MKKDKKARLLTMDELCSRPCEVDGIPALFHRWIDEDRVLVRAHVLTAAEAQEAVKRRFRSEGFLPGGYSTEVIRETFALIEYRDGRIAKVKPELIRFVDKEGGYADY